MINRTLFSLGSDYNINENPFVINSTVLNGCIDVEVLDDDFFENDDFVSFTLTSPTNGVQIVNGFLNITIENDDCKLIIIKPLSLLT